MEETFEDVQAREMYKESCFKDTNPVGICKLVQRRQKLEVVFYRTKMTVQARENGSQNRKGVVAMEEEIQDHQEVVWDWDQKWASKMK